MEVFNTVNKGTYYFFSFQFRRLAGLFPLLEPLLRIGNLLGEYWVFVLVVIWTVTLLRDRPRMLTDYLAILLIGLVLVEGTRWLVPSPRPPEAWDHVSRVERQNGFPSRNVFLATLGWMLLAGVLATGFERRRSRIQIHLAALGIVLWVVQAQLFLSLDYLGNILGGLVGGGGLTALFWYWQGSPNPRTQTHA